MMATKKTKKLRVLVACERSGVVRDAFTAVGCDAWSCDTEPTMTAGKHIVADALSVINDGWDILIAHPPCTYLSFAGNRHWNAPGRPEQRENAMRFFLAMYQAPIPHVCIENPNGYPVQAFRKPDQIVHPYFFGDDYMKRTCLWLRGLPTLFYGKFDELFPCGAVARPEPVYVTARANGAIKLRHKTEALHGGDFERSKTSLAIAAAMAKQWGEKP